LRWVREADEMVEAAHRRLVEFRGGAGQIADPAQAPARLKEAAGLVQPALHRIVDAIAGLERGSPHNG
jgi:hypothetical protein